MPKKIGVVHGKFQPFHLDHLKYALAANERCDHLIVGITNPDPSLTDKDPTDPNRSLRSSNPLSYYQRFLIIRETLLQAGIPYCSFDIVPFPVCKPSLIQYYVPAGATFFITIYDDWGYRKRDMLSAQGLQVSVLWERALAEKGISASEIRRNIAMGKPWEHLVPPVAVKVMLDNQMDIAIRQASTLDGELGEVGS